MDRKTSLCTTAQDSRNPQHKMPWGRQSTPGGAPAPEAAAGRGRLEAEQDPGPARLKESHNPAAPAESPINTDTLIKIAPEAEKLHQPPV